MPSQDAGIKTDVAFCLINLVFDMLLEKEMRADPLLHGIKSLHISLRHEHCFLRILARCMLSTWVWFQYGSGKV